MFAIGFGFLVLFSVISVLVGHEEPRQQTDPRDNPLLWARYIAR